MVPVPSSSASSRSFDQSRHAIARKQELIASLNVTADCVDLQLLRDADCARDDVGVGMIDRLVRGQHARVHQALDQAVVAGQLDDLAFAKQIGAAVAGPEAAIASVGDGEPDDRASDRLVRRRLTPASAIRFVIDPLERGDRAVDQRVQAVDDRQVRAAPRSPWRWRRRRRHARPSRRRPPTGRAPSGPAANPRSPSGEVRHGFG